MRVMYMKGLDLDRPEILGHIFHPRRDTVESPPDGVRQLLIPVDTGIQVGARMHPASSDAPCILFFHGNGEIASDYDDVGPSYVRSGFTFIAVDYRGYGKSTGEPTVSAMLSDAHIVFESVRALLKEEGRDGPLVVMGRSLGSVSAIELAAAYDDDIAGLVLDSAFASTVALLGRIGVPVSELGITEEETSINVDSIARVTKPTLIIHGQRDQLIPLTDAEVLMSYAAAHKRRLLVVPGADHNDIMYRCGEAYFETVREFFLGPRRRRLRGA